MIAEVVTVLIDGRAQRDVTPDIVEIVAEEDTASAAVFRMRIGLQLRKDGTWSYVDDDRFQVWRRFALRAGYPVNPQTLIDGFVTHTELAIGARGNPYLEVSGMDATAVMDLQEKQIAWLNKKDHEIAVDIFRSYGLSAEVEDTATLREATVAVTMQAETDIRFLRRLALRSGFECFVRGTTGFFRSPNMQDLPQPTLAIEFGSQTNLRDLRLAVDGTPATVVEMRRIDPLEKRVEIRERSVSPRRALGRRSLAALGSGLPAGRTLLRSQAAVSAAEMDARLRQAYQPATEFVRAEGEIDSRLYGHVLRANRLVTIKGVGRSFSGLYYVTRVRHSFTLDGYSQRFEAYRNGIGLTGAEDFSVADTLVPALAGAAVSANRRSGDRVRPAQQTEPTTGGGA